MNNNDLKKEKFSSLELYEPSNNREEKPEEISNLFELQDITKKVEELQREIDNISSNVDIDKTIKIIKIQKLNEELNKLKARLSVGISADFSKIKEEIIENIINYLETFGYPKEQIIQKLNNIELFVTNERIKSGGLMATVDNRIGIDYSVIEFDSKGNIIGFKKDKEMFVKYVLTHEFLHVCSAKGNISFRDDALSEGLTDMFAHIISNNFDDKSNLYDIFVKICMILSNVVGLENILDDYVNNLDTTPHLRTLFCDKLSFLEFYQEMNQLLHLKMNKADTNKINLIQCNLLNKLKEEIFIPFLQNKKNKEEYINLFNNFFSEYGVSCSIDEIKNEEKNI